MKSIRIEPLGISEFAIDVVCECGQNGLHNLQTGQQSFKHRAQLGDALCDFTLACECGREFRVRSQGSHIHVDSTPMGR